jgi:cysteine synthase A
MPNGAVPDALVMGVGTGGTLIGVGRAFRAVNPRAKVIGVEPDESCTILCGDTGRHVIEGIADGFVPGIVARNLGIIDDVVAVSGEESIAEMRRLAHEHGLFVGPSSGAHLVAARRLRDQHPDSEHIVTILCDEGEKYLSEHFGTGDSEGPSPPLPWSTTHPHSSPGSPDPSVTGSGAERAAGP